MHAGKPLSLVPSAEKERLTPLIHLQLINPQRRCAARVTVVVLCVCLCVRFLYSAFSRF